MKESQTIEWKASWRDEYLRWICGFANAEGGVLTIGRDDAGRAVGVKDARKLLEEIPNKVRDLLGIVVGVRLRREAGKELVEIRVDPYPSPISYKGEYHYRSGATKQELKGAALDKFLLRRYGRTWDGVPVPHAKTRELSRTAATTFLRLAKGSGRDDSVRGVGGRESMASLVERLNLVEGAYLKRAAVLLFHPNPERYVTGAFVKIGYFVSDAELLYHDEIRGDLFTQVQQTLDLLLTKYLKAVISYRGIQRVETFPVPEEALREALLNAIIHRDYSTPAPIQIRVTDNRLSIWNPAELPPGWSVARLLRPHPSVPFNPCIANAFFRAGEIEAWGRGIERLIDACRSAKVPSPRITELPGELLCEFPFSLAYQNALTGSPGDQPRVGIDDDSKVGIEISADPDERPSSTSRGAHEDIDRVGIDDGFGVGIDNGPRVGIKVSENQHKILEILKRQPDRTAVELAALLRISLRKVEQNLAVLREGGMLQRVGSRRFGHWKVLS